MLKILREYSYLLSLGCSFFLVFFLYLAGWLPEDILHDLEEKSVSAEHITFMEKEDFIPEFLRNPGNTETETDLLQIEEFLIEELLAKEEQQKEEIREEKSGKEGEPLGENSDLEVEKAGDLESGIPEAANGKENPPATEKIHADKKEELQERIEKEAGKRQWSFETRDVSYFEDALFIGDSRTEGLREYGSLGNASVIADSGMSIYRLWKESYTVKGEKMTLEEVLNKHQFGKIYLMLGVNELGYDFGQTKKKYKESLEIIEKTQPQATVYLQANLHVTDEKSKNSDIYNNENINRMNQLMEELAEEKGFVYLDVNPLFDDENGNLSKEYTVDQAHILGIYYIDWANWILEHCAFPKESKG